MKYSRLEAEKFLPGEEQEGSSIRTDSYSLERHPLRHPEVCHCHHAKLWHFGVPWCLATLVSVSAILYVFATSHPDRARKEWTLPGSELNGLIPEYPRVAVRFKNDSDYEIWPNTPRERREQIKKNWAGLVPNGRGFIATDSLLPDMNWENYVLPPPLEKTPDGEGKLLPANYGTSVFHQIHCLYGIMELLHAYHFDEMDLVHHDAEHTFHCFEYLRQTIMCSADMALEGGTEGPGTFGWGTTHMCRDYDAVKTLAEEKRVQDNQGIQ